MSPLAENKRTLGNKSPGKRRSAHFKSIPTRNAARQQGTREQQRMEGNDIVKLNVGGMQYVTTRDTLMAYGDNFFSALLSEKFKVAKEGEHLHR